MSLLAQITPTPTWYLILAAVLFTIGAVYAVKDCALFPSNTFLGHGS